MGRKVIVELDIPDNAVLCALDYPGFVYDNGPRLAFFDLSGKIIEARSPTQAELVLLQSELNSKGKSTVDERAIREFLCRKYVQRADARQRELGLQYTEVETTDLARELAAFIAGSGGGGPRVSPDAEQATHKITAS